MQMSVWLVFIAGMSAGIALERAVPAPPEGWAWWAMAIHSVVVLAIALAVSWRTKARNAV